MFSLDLSQVEGLTDNSLQKNFVVPNIKFEKGNNELNDSNRLTNYSRVFPSEVLEKLRKEPLFQKRGGRPDLVAALSGLESNITGLYKNLSGTTPAAPTKDGISKGTITLLPKRIMRRMFENHPVLMDKYLESANIKMKEFTDYHGLTVSAPKMSNSGDVVANVYSDEDNNYAYYDDKTPNGMAKTNMLIDSLNAGAFKNMDLAEKKSYFDELAQGVGQSNGGLLVKTAIALKPKLTRYKMALQKPESETVFALKKFFKEHPNKDLFRKNPQLALYVIRAALPNNIDDAPIYENIKFRGILNGRAYEDTIIGQEELRKLKIDSKNADLKEVGFPKPEQVDFKIQTTNRIMQITQALKDVIQKGGGKDPKTGLYVPAFVGAAGDTFVMFKGATDQANQFGQIFNSLFRDKKSIEAIQGAKDRALKAYDGIQKATGASQQVKAKLLIDYYAEILTFTMAGTIQSGSQGTVDTRTISDSDVRRIGNALRQKLALAIQGDTTVLDEILSDYGRKKFILDNITAPNRRSQSATVLYNRVLEDISLFDARNLEENYDVEPNLQEIDVLDVNKDVNKSVDQRFNLSGEPKNNQSQQNKLTFTN